MEFFARTGNPAGQRTDCAIIGVYRKGVLPEASQVINKAIGGHLDALKKRGDLSSRVGDSLWLPDVEGAACRGLLVVGLGEREQFNEAVYRRVVSSAVTRLRDTGVRDAISYLSHELESNDDVYRWVRVGVEAVGEAIYQYSATVSEKRKKRSLGRFGFALSQGKFKRAAEKGLRHGEAIAGGVELARELGNLPANVCTPSYLARTATAMARKYKNLKSEILGPAQIKKLGMGAFLSVTQGAKEPPRLIVLKYGGAAASSKPIVLVGKGITFDTGGISIKPAPTMDEMKFDMCGAAAVLGATQVVAELDLPINLVMVVASCENMPGSKATRPGDVVKTMSGKTVEILNTDAEGRLILCDALTYARRFKPDTVLDFATLTGACVVALGGAFSGIFSPDSELANELVAAGNRAVDTAWRLPIHQDYTDQLRSNFADIANSGTREGGASIAAGYLGEFTKGLRWAHVDIAGTAWKSGKAKGATGRPIPMLIEYLIGRS